jgi:hypothetical protein
MFLIPLKSASAISPVLHLTEEEVYEIFRKIFPHEEDALAATIQLFNGESWSEDYE